MVQLNTHSLSRNGDLIIVFRKLKKIKENYKSGFFGIDKNHFNVCVCLFSVCIFN